MKNKRGLKRKKPNHFKKRKAVSTSKKVSVFDKGRITNFDNNRKVKFIAWDVVDLCNRKKCPCAKLCKHDPTKPRYNERKGLPNKGSDYDPEPRCIVQLDAIRELQLCLVNAVPANVSQMEMFRIGTELVPLYKQWAKLNMYEVGSSVIVSGKGKMGDRANPVMKELRSVVREIRQVWKSLDIKWRERTEIPDAPATEDHFGIGDMNYYELMEAGKIKGLGKGRKLKRISR